MTKVTDLEANLEQFKIEQAAINSEAAKQLALLQATIEKNKVEADQQFAEIMNALKALQPPTTLLEDTTTMIDTEKSGEDCGNLDEFMVASDADLMLGSEGKSIQRVSCDPRAGNKSVEKENIKSGITCEENFYQPYRRVVEQSHNMFQWHAMRLKRRRGIYLGHLETIFWFKQGSKRRVWDPGITGALNRSGSYHFVEKKIVIVAMATEIEIEKFNGSHFSLWKLKMKVILRKDKCLAAIGERPFEVTNDSKWDEIDENAIINPHLSLAGGVLLSIKDNKSAKEI
ncbi:hypothetical protein Tco_1257142 [Tanacetum coccineum]